MEDLFGDFLKLNQGISEIYCQCRDNADFDKLQGKLKTPDVKHCQYFKGYFSFYDLHEWEACNVQNSKQLSPRPTMGAAFSEQNVAGILFPNTHAKGSQREK